MLSLILQHPVEMHQILTPPVTCIVHTDLISELILPSASCVSSNGVDTHNLASDLAKKLQSRRPLKWV